MGLVKDLYQHFRAQRLVETLERSGVALGDVDESLASIGRAFGHERKRQAAALVEHAGRLADATGVGQEAADRFVEHAAELEKRAATHAKLHPLVVGELGRYLSAALGSYSAFGVVQDLHQSTLTSARLQARVSAQAASATAAFSTAGYEIGGLNAELRATLRRYYQDPHAVDALLGPLLAESGGNRREAARLAKRLATVHSVFGGSLDDFWSDVRRESHATGRTVDAVLDSWVEVYAAQRETNTRLTLAGAAGTAAGLRVLARDDFLMAAREAAQQLQGSSVPLTEIARRGAVATRAAGELGASYAATLQLVKDISSTQLQANAVVLARLGSDVARDVQTVLADVAAGATSAERERLMRATLLGFVNEAQVDDAVRMLKIYESGNFAVGAAELGRLAQMSEDGSARYLGMLRKHLKTMGSEGAVQMLTQQLGSAVRAQLVYRAIQLDDFATAQQALAGEATAAGASTVRGEKITTLEQEMALATSGDVVTGAMARALQAVEHPLGKAATALTLLARNAVGLGYAQQGQAMLGYYRAAIQYGVAAGMSPWTTRSIMMGAGLQKALSKIKDPQFIRGAAGAMAVATLVHRKYAAAEVPEPEPPTVREAEQVLGMTVPRVEEPAPAPQPRPPRIVADATGVPPATRGDRPAALALRKRRPVSKGLPFTPLQAANPDLETAKERAARQAYNERMGAVFEQLDNPLELLAFLRLRGSMQLPKQGDELAVALSRKIVQRDGLLTGPEFLRTAARFVPKVRKSIAGSPGLGVAKRAHAAGAAAERDAFVASVTRALGGAISEAGDVTLTIPGFGHFAAQLDPL